MSDSNFRGMLEGVSLDDIRIDHLGRAVIVSPSVAEKLKGAATLTPDSLAGSDTNIICCGNQSCAKPTDLKDLGVLAERFTRGGVR